jgi:hypothetical protein
LREDLGVQLNAPTRKNGFNCISSKSIAFKKSSSNRFVSIIHLCERGRDVSKSCPLTLIGQFRENAKPMRNCCVAVNPVEYDANTLSGSSVF